MPPQSGSSQLNPSISQDSRFSGQERHPEFSPHSVRGIHFKAPSQQSTCTGLERKERWEEPTVFHSTLHGRAGRNLLPPSIDSSESKKQSSRLNRKTSKCGGFPSASHLFDLQVITSPFCDPCYRQKAVHWVFLNNILWTVFPWDEYIEYEGWWEDLQEPVIDLSDR